MQRPPGDQDVGVGTTARWLPKSLQQASAPAPRKNRVAIPARTRREWTNAAGGGRERSFAYGILPSGPRVTSAPSEEDVVYLHAS